MKSIFKKSILMAALVLPGVLPVGQALAQADSTTGNSAMNWRAIVPLYAQERETPQVTNTTNVAVTQVVQPNTYEVSNGSGGWNVAAAGVDCGGGRMLGGGGNCSGPGLTALTISQPNGNGWYARCDAVNDGAIGVSVYAVCSQ